MRNQLERYRMMVTVKRKKLAYHGIYNRIIKRLLDMIITGTALLILSVVLIAAGVSNGSAKDVFGKAIKICTECVGLG